MKSVVIFLVSITIALSTLAADKPNKQLAIEYLEVAQFENVSNTAIETFGRQLLTQFPGEKGKLLQKKMNETMGWTATKDQIAELVINVFTAEELKSYIAFSKTKAGRSYNEKSTEFAEKYYVVVGRNTQKFIDQNLVPSAKPEEAQRVPK